MILPGAASENKRWPISNFVELINNCFSRYNWDCVICGAAEDKMLGDELVRQVNPQIHMCNLIGKTTLIDMAALIGQASLIVGNDSGPTHLASYFNRPVVVIFGPTDPKKYGPWGECGTFLQDNFTEKKPDIPKVMNSIEVLLNSSHHETE